MTSRIQRTGAVVRLPANFWTAGLLRRLQAAGFPAPRPLDTEDDRELLTWIDGESSWFLHRYHDTVAGYRPSLSLTRNTTVYTAEARSAVSAWYSSESVPVKPRWGM